MPHTEKLTNPSSLEHDSLISKTRDDAAMGRTVETVEIGIDEATAKWQVDYGVHLSSAYGDTAHRRLMRDNERRESLVGWTEVGTKNALDYLCVLFPDRNFELISDNGSSAVVFGDEHFAYKVFRSPDGYSYIEGEIASLQRLHHLGLAPKPVALIDATPDEQRDYATSELRTTKFSDERTPRVQSNGQLPIIVMERVQSPVNLHQAPHGALKRLPDMILEFMQNDIALGDTELSYDMATERLVVLDCGGVSDMRGLPDDEKTRRIQNTLSMIYTLDLGLPRPEDQKNPTIDDWMRLITRHVEQY